MLSLADLGALLLTLSAVFAWLNHRYVKLPHTIGLLVIGLLASLVLILFELAVPEEELYEALTSALRQIDFNATLMEGMLAFLLFAGALHVDLDELRGRAWPVGADGLARRGAVDRRDRCRHLARIRSRWAGLCRWPGRWCSAR